MIGYFNSKTFIDDTISAKKKQNKFYLFRRCCKCLLRDNCKWEIKLIVIIYRSARREIPETRYVCGFMQIIRSTGK